ncbi:MAG: hypothetical protein WEA24_06515 [Gemmatimonadota bacterium]
MILLQLTTGPVAAQAVPPAGTGGATRWAVIDAIGYGGLGFGVGVLASWNMESDDFGPPAGALLVIGAGTLTGTVGGAVLGFRARQRTIEREPLGRGHGTAALAGGVLAGATLGALTSASLINGAGEGTFLGSDETTFATLVLAGGVLGSMYVWGIRHEIRVAPVGGGAGSYGLRARVRF